MLLGGGGSYASARLESFRVGAGVRRKYSTCAIDGTKTSTGAMATGWLQQGIKAGCDFGAGDG